VPAQIRARRVEMGIILVMSFLLPVAAGMVSVLIPAADEFQNTFVLGFVVVAVRPDETSCSF
jgi:hypothetical protein